MGAARGLLVDAGGVLLTPARPVEETYLAYAAPWGVRRSPEEVRRAFGAAFRSSGQQVGDGRAFWRRVVALSTGVEDEALFEALYEHYRHPVAWVVAEGALECFAALRARGWRVAVVSNWDNRLPSTVDALKIPVDRVVCSGEVGVEKPDPRIFHAALRALEVNEAVHVGDSPREDLEGAAAAGLEAWLWGRDVHSFGEIRARLEART